MKRILLILLLFCIVLCSCTKTEPGENLPEAGKGSTVHESLSTEYQNSAGGVAEYSPHMVWQMRKKLAVYEEQVFYEIDADDGKGYVPKIYTASLLGDHAPYLIFNGVLLGLCENVLLAYDDVAYYAFDLENG